MLDQVLTPSDFVAVLNQTLEYAYPAVVIEGELSNFRVAKNRWTYFNLKDEFSSVPYFGTVHQLPGPLEDGLMVRAVGSPRMHPRFGFTINLKSIVPVGEGALKKAADLLFKKLEAEGLFLPERKRVLPYAPSRIGLITAKSSAAYADFVKILNERWGGVEVLYIDVHVQGDQAPGELVAAIEHFNQMSPVPEVIIMTRGGGSSDDLAAFSDERVVRAVAASRVPTLVAIGHETDISLAELAADMQASTPSNAAVAVVPDRKSVLAALKNRQDNLSRVLNQTLQELLEVLNSRRENLKTGFEYRLNRENDRLITTKKLLGLFNPEVALKRGYALVNKGALHINSISQVKAGDALGVMLQDGTILADVQEVVRKQ